MSEILQVTTAIDSHDACMALARSAVELRLAAGAQVIGPIEAVFWHSGELGTGSEYLAVFKTTTERYPALAAHLREHHPWASPDISAVPIVYAIDTCVEWVRRTDTGG